MKTIKIVSKKSTALRIGLAGAIFSICSEANAALVAMNVTNGGTRININVTGTNHLTRLFSFNSSGLVGLDFFGPAPGTIKYSRNGVFRRDGNQINAFADRQNRFDPVTRSALLLGAVDGDDNWLVLDLDRNGSVDTAIQLSISSTTPTDSKFLRGFHDDRGASADILTLTNGSFSSLSTTVPEPSSTALLALGSLALLMHRKK